MFYYLFIVFPFNVQVKIRFTSRLAMQVAPQRLLTAQRLPKPEALNPGAANTMKMAEKKLLQLQQEVDHWKRHFEAAQEKLRDSGRKEKVAAFLPSSPLQDISVNKEPESLYLRRLLEENMHLKLQLAREGQGAKEGQGGKEGRTVRIQEVERDTPADKENLSPQPQNLNTVPHNLRRQPQNLRPEPQNLRPEPQNLRPEPQNLRPEPQNLRPEAQNLRPETQNLGPEPQSMCPEPPNPNLLDGSSDEQLQCGRVQHLQQHNRCLQHQVLVIMYSNRYSMYYITPGIHFVLQHQVLYVRGVFFFFLWHFCK